MVTDPAGSVDAIRVGDPGGVVALCLAALPDGAAFLDALDAAASARRRVVILHTALQDANTVAIPGERVREALLDAHGAIVAESHRDLLDLAFTLGALPRLPTRGRVAILTGGGGGGVIAADLCSQAGLQVPQLSAETRERLVPLVPSIASTGNPVDLTPEMFTERFYDRFGEVLDVVAVDAAIDAVLLPTTFNAPRGNTIGAQVLADFARRCPKPVLVAANPAREMQEIFAATGVAVIPDVANAARALAKLVRRGAWSEAPQSGERPARPSGGISMASLRAAGFRVAERHPMPAAPAAAVEAARTIGFPVVLSADGSAAFASSDIWDAAELEQARARLLMRGAAPESLVLRRDLQGRLALRIMATRDPIFGPVVGIGAGGVHARVLHEIAIRRAPFDAAAARSLLTGHPVVTHTLRVEPGLGLARAAETLAQFSLLVAAEDAPRFDLVLDPVEILPDGLNVLDTSLSRSAP